LALQQGHDDLGTRLEEMDRLNEASQDIQCELTVGSNKPARAGIRVP
jgi:hypothetical protein